MLINGRVQPYLSIRSRLLIKRIFAQIRLQNKSNDRICLGQKVYRFEDDVNCSDCGLEVKNLFHILVNCPACAHLCEAAFPDVFTKSDNVEGWISVMSSSNLVVIKSFVYFLHSLLGERLSSRALNISF